MKNKLFLIPVIAIMMLFGMVLKADAYIQNEYDIQVTMQKLEDLRNTDISSFVNRGEIIGTRLDDFNMIYSTYTSYLSAAIAQLGEIKNEIQKFNNMQGIQEQERFAQISKLYQTANTVVQNVNLQTNSFVYNSSKPMPTITYDRFKKKFMAYYFSLGI